MRSAENRIVRPTAAAMKRVESRAPGLATRPLDGVAFACLLACQFLAVVAVHNARWYSGSSERHVTGADARTRRAWNFGS